MGYVPVNNKHLRKSAVLSIAHRGLVHVRKSEQAISFSQKKRPFLYLMCAECVHVGGKSVMNNSGLRIDGHLPSPFATDERSVPVSLK